MHLAGHKYKYDVIEARKKTTERSKEDKNSKIELKISSVHLVNIFLLPILYQFSSES